MLAHLKLVCYLIIKLLRYNTMLKLLTLLALFISLSNSWASEAGKVTHLSGVLIADRLDGSQKILSVNSPVLEGDTLRTEEDTYARLKLTDNAEIVLRPETEFKLNQHHYQANEMQQNNSSMELIKGGMRAVTGLIGKNNPDAVKIGTPTATIGIRGTHLGLLFCQDNCANIPTPSGNIPANGLHADVVEGAISLTNGAGTMNIGSGQFGYVKNAYTAPTLVPPTQGVQVTMPPSISQNNSKGKGVGKSGDTECAIQ
jgi:hypothetical protein